MNAALLELLSIYLILIDPRLEEQQHSKVINEIKDVYNPIRSVLYSKMIKIRILYNPNIFQQ